MSCMKLWRLPLALNVEKTLDLAKFYVTLKLRQVGYLTPGLTQHDGRF